MENNNLNPEQVEEVAEPCETAPAEEVSPAPAVEIPAEEIPADEAPAEAPINKKKLALVLLGLLAIVALIVIAIVAATGGFSNTPDETVPATTVAAPDGSEPVGTESTDPTPESTFVPSMSDEEAATAMRLVVARMGQAELTNGQLSAVYWMTYYDFLSQMYNYGIDPTYFGLDPSQPLDEQECTMGVEGQSWHDYFLEEALAYWADYQALALACQENGISLDPSDLAQLQTLEDSLNQSAASYGYDSADAMLRDDFGAGVTLADYKGYVEIMLLANRFYAANADAMEFTEAELEAYYEENAELFAEAGIVKDNSPSAINVRHILIIPEGEQATDPETGLTGYTAEQMTQAENAARQILDQWAAGEATEESFAALAGTHSQDPGSVNNGGLYTNVTPGQMVVPFNDWCFNPERQVGDTGLVQTSYGVHVMYFSAVSDATPYWMGSIRQELLNTRLTELAEQVAADHPYEVDMEAVVISEVDTTRVF